MSERKIVLEFENVYYTMEDIINAVIKYYQDKKVGCEVLGKDAIGNPILFINSKGYTLKVRNVGPGLVQYTLPPGTSWPTFMSAQQIILTEL
ncbi:MAG TPA: hypothetical protein GXX15_05180 [Clostridia bacterium]|nr:hypothetical protein [Clostridia bacterium]